MVIIEKAHLNICNKLANELNIAARRLKNSSNDNSYTLKEKAYEKLLAKQDISVEEKKRLIISNIHEIAVNAFSINFKKSTSYKKILEALKSNISTLRKFVMKLRDINYYLQNVFLAELRLAKSNIRIGNLKEADIERLIKQESGCLNKTDFERLEHTVYKLIEKTIFLDQSLLDKYKKREERIAKESKLEINDIEGILKRQSELLCHLEAKLPPKSEIKAKLLKKAIFTEWVLRVVALIAALENEYRKEGMIFSKLKKNRSIGIKINAKIKHLVKEKWGLLRLEEKRLLSMKSTGNIDERHQKISHNYSSVLRL